jgi:hypothetical protein
LLQRLRINQSAPNFFGRRGDDLAGNDALPAVARDRLRALSIETGKSFFPALKLLRAATFEPIECACDINFICHISRIEYLL